MEYRQVDVFTRKPLSGNGLAVFHIHENLSTSLRKKITNEMRQFESIFLTPTKNSQSFKAKIYTMEEELDFAGHPLLGAAATLHEKYQPSSSVTAWTFVLNTQNVQVISKACAWGYQVVMEQRNPVIHPPLDKNSAYSFLDALNLSSQNASADFPLQVISTGLPYLIVPLKNGLDQARILPSNFEQMLKTIQAKFVYILDVNALEGRTWDNAGKVEDIATGSAAGPVGIYLVQHQKAVIGKSIILNQGRFTGRPSKIEILVKSDSQGKITSVSVGGGVCMVGKGTIDENILSKRVKVPGA